jgi:hypothetical protein
MNRHKGIQSHFIASDSQDEKDIQTGVIAFYDYLKAGIDDSFMQGVKKKPLH